MKLNYSLAFFSTAATFAFCSQPQDISVIPAYLQLARKFNISELLSVEDSCDLAIFGQLALIQDEEYLYNCLKQYCIERDVFSVNNNRILSYLLRKFDSKMSSNEQAQLFNKLIQLKDYDRLAELVITFPKVLNAVKVDDTFQVKDGKRMIERIMKVDETLYRKVTGDTINLFDQELASVKIYDLILNSINVPLSNNLFIFSSIFANIPDHLYFQKIINVSPQDFKKFIERLVCKMEIFEDEENIERIYQFISRLLNSIPKSKDIPSYILLNQIRFGKVSVVDITLPKDHLHFGMPSMLRNAADLARKPNVFSFVYQEVQQEFNQELPSTHVLVSIIESFPDDPIFQNIELKSLLDILSRKYNIVNVVTMERKQMRIALVIRPESEGKGLPVNFEFTFACNSFGDLTTLCNQFFLQDAYHTPETLMVFLKGLVPFKSELPRFNTNAYNRWLIKVSCKTSAIIAQSSELKCLIRELSLKFN